MLTSNSRHRKQAAQSGFVTMIVVLLLIIGAVLFLAFRRVIASQHS